MKLSTPSPLFSRLLSSIASSALLRAGLLLALFLAYSGQAFAAIRYVKPTATGSGDGSTWANASGDLQAMINASAAGDEVWVAAGTYKPNAYPSGCSGCSTNRDFAFHLKDGVKLYGGFAGAETLLSQRNIAANPSILSGDFNNDDVVTGSGSTLSITGNGENAYHVVLSVSDAATTVLDGFTVRGGNANNGGSITVESQTIFRDGGGGMFNRNASPSITNTTFNGNRSNNGGGMYNNTSSPIINNTTFTGNSASFGGGMRNINSSNPSITNTTFTGNSAVTGGGMLNLLSSPMIRNSTFTGNSSSSTSSNGGGMWNSSSNPIIRNSILWGNGTEISNSSSIPTVSYSIVQGGYTGCSNCPGGDGNADPLFVDAANPAGSDGIHRTADDGLRLQLGSPSINAGDPAITTPATDITGATRGAAPFDLGAYEGGVCPTATTLYVDQSVSSSGNGSTWATALKTLDEALFIAHNCPGVNTINVAAGTYRPTKKPYASGVEITTSDARDITFHLANGVAMYGGFPNGGGTRDIAANPTILSGDFNGDDVVTGSGSTLSITGNGENAYHVVLSVSDAATTVLDGFTVSGGNANSGGSITVESQTIFRNNGGGMYNFSSSSPSITNTTFTGNSANAGGGGMYNSSSSPSITNTTFTRNSATNFGGGMYNISSSPSITNTTFTGNSADSEGGGMFNFNSSSPSITNTTFTGNSANSGGGMFNFNSSSPSITNTTFTGNSANAGGGMFNAVSSSPNITNTTFTGNSATTGGGIRNSSSNPTIRNSILWGNGTEIANSSSDPVVSYSIVQGGYTGTGNINADPLFVNAANGNLRLQSCSPAINAGLNSAVPSGITTDLDGNPRFFNSGIVDMGAYEFQGTAAAVTCYQDSDNDGFGNPAVSQVFCGTCGAGFVSDNTDCNDADNAVNPLAPEVCDGIDNNCNNQTDEGNACAVTLSPTMLQLNETGETTGTFTVSLGSAPPNNVTIQLTFNSSQLRVNTGSGLGASPQTVTLTPANALTGGTVTVQAIDDAIAEASPHEVIITTANTASSAPFFNNLAVDDVVVSIADNDAAGVMITQSSGGTAVSEDGATDTYTIRLNSQPTSNVSVAIAFPETDITLNGDTDGIFNTTFTTANWNTPQTITVAAVNDRALEGNHSGDLVHSFSSADANYNGITAVVDGATNTNTLTVAITDNESAVLAWNPTSGAASEGTTNSTSVRLDITADPPGGTPTLKGAINYGITTTFGTAEAADIGTITGSLSFTNATDLASNTITIQHNNDLLVEGPETYTLALGLISAPAGVTLAGPHFIGTITDADNATVSLSGSATVSEADGTHNAVVTLSTTNGATLAKELVIPVHLVDNTAIFNGATGDMYLGTSASPANTTTVTFPAGSGNGATQNVPINIHDDRTVEASTSSSTGFNTPENFDVTFGTLPAIVTATTHTITVTIDENDFAYITMSRGFVVNDQVDIESNTSRTSNVRVRIIANGSGPEQVQDAFSVPVQSSGLGQPNDATVGEDYMAVSTTVTFPAGSLNNAQQPVSITVINDDIDEFYGALGPFNQNREVFDVGFHIPSVRASYAGVPILIPDNADDNNCNGTNGLPNLSSPCRSRHTHIILDDDAAGVVVTETGGNTAVVEGGAGDTYTVVLATQPTSNVTVNLAFDQTQVTVNGDTDGATSLIFTTANWATPQTVSVFAVNDALVEGNPHTSLITQTISSTDLIYNAINPADVTVSITDNDLATIVFVNQSSSVNETTASHNVIARLNLVTNGSPGGTLSGALTANVDVTLGTAESTDFTQTTTQVTFTAGAANGATQNIGFTIANDLLLEGNETFTLGFGTVSGTGSASGNHEVTITDDESGSITFTTANSTASEGTTPHNVGVQLVISGTGTGNAQVENDVTVAISNTPGTATTPADYTIASTSVTFSAGTNSPISGTIASTIVNDALVEANDETFSLGFGTVTGSGSITATGTHTVTIDENDSATVAFEAGNDSVSETFGVFSKAVTLTITSDPAGGTLAAALSIPFGFDELSATEPEDFTLVGTTIDFPAGSGNGTTRQAQANIVDDFIDEDAEFFELKLNNNISTLPGIQNITLTRALTTVQILDNDIAGITVNPTTVAVNEEGPTSQNYTVVLTSQPTANVTINLAFDAAQITVNGDTDGALSLTFTAANWDTPQSVTVQAVNDFIAEGSHSTTIVQTVASSDAKYNILNPADVTVNITDNDMSGAQVTESGGSTNVSEANVAATDSYTIQLTSRPTQNVTVNIVFDPAQISLVADGTPFNTSPATITIAPADWNVLQTVEVIAIDDNVDEANPHTSNITQTFVSTDPNYNTATGGVNPADVTVSIADNDVAGVTISETGGSTNVAEGGATDTYTVVLNSQPTADVTITINPGTQLTVGQSPLTFTTTNWNIAQIVTVTAVDDNVFEGNHTGTIMHTISSSDVNYNYITVALVMVNITDGDVACPAAGIVHVNANSPGGGDGLSWNTAFDKLQDALNLACNCVGDKPEIWVAQGTYYPDEGVGQTDNDRNSTFQLCNNVALYGGFFGTETLLEDRDWITHVTTLSGDIGMPSDSTDNSYHVVTGSSTDATAVLDGFTITGGNADSSFPNSSGGGMYNNAGSPTVTNCTFSENSADTAGGGMFNIISSSPTVTNCTFSGNMANSSGGGMFNILSSSPTVTNCTFSGNTTSFSGGGMTNDLSSSPTVTNCTFSGNTATNFGGGMINASSSSPTVTNCTFSGNTAGLGSGMINFDSSSPTITNCIIWNNSASGSTTSASASVTNFTSSTPTFSHSLIANSGGSTSWANAIGTNGGNNIDADPQFVAPLAPGLSTGGDYRLQASSPAINAGSNAAVPMGVTTDLDGNPRFVNSGIVDMGAYEFQGALAAISGTIRWEHDNTPVPDATVALSGDDTGNDDTDSAGDYAIPTTGGNLTVTPTKQLQPRRGVDAADVTRIRQHVLATVPFTDPYKRIAADVNQSNSITNADAAIIQQALLNNVTAGTILDNPAWRFVNTDYLFPNPSAPWGFPSSVNLPGVTANVPDVDFIGVKIGDVNGTWATSSLLVAPPLTWQVADQWLEAGHSIRVPFTVQADMADVAAWQFALRFDPAQVALGQVIPRTAVPLTREEFGISTALDGELRSVFAVAEGLAVKAGEVAFELELHVRRGGMRLSEVLRLDDAALEGRVYDTDLNAGTVKLAFAPARDKPGLDGVAAYQEATFELYQNVPNPFAEETMIAFNLPTDAVAVITIQDASGRVVAQLSGDYAAGYNNVQLTREVLQGASGVLSYTVTAGAYTATRRMVLVR